jgi:hypothetical protein
VKRPKKTNKTEKEREHAIAKASYAFCSLKKEKRSSLISSFVGFDS